MCINISRRIYKNKKSFVCTVKDGLYILILSIYFSYPLFSGIPVIFNQSFWSFLWSFHTRTLDHISQWSRMKGRVVRGFSESETTRPYILQFEMCVIRPLFNMFTYLCFWYNPQKIHPSWPKSTIRKWYVQILKYCDPIIFMNHYKYQEWVKRDV